MPGNYTSNYINQSTRVVFITFSFYSPTADYFVVVDIMVEFFISGYVQPTYLNVMPFRANIFENSSEKAL